MIFSTWHSFCSRNSTLFLTFEWSNCFMYKWKFSLLDSKSKYFGTTIFLDWRPLLSVHGCHTDNDWPKPTQSGVLVQSDLWKKRTVLLDFGRNRFCSLCLHHDWVFISLDLSLWIQSTNSFELTCWRISNPHWTQHCSVVQVCNWKYLSFTYCSMHWKTTNLFIFFQIAQSYSKPGWIQEKICLAFQPNLGSTSSSLGICHLWGSVQFTKWRKYEMKRNRPILLEIQNTKWKNPIYEMEKSNLRNEIFLYYYWKYPKYGMEKSNLRNKTILGLATQLFNLRNGLRTLVLNRLDYCDG